MKKFWFFIILLALAVACAAPPTNDVALDTNRNTNDTGSTAPVMTESAAIDQEKAIWETIKNRDADAFARMLAEDQIEVGSEGIHDKAGTVASVKAFEPSEVTFSDWKFLPISKNVFLVNYTAALKGKYQGREFPPGSIRESSAWVYRDGKWLGIYHQTTDLKPAPPPPPAPATSPAQSPASPGASPQAITTGPDAIANEKAIWEALKTKDYDGFASALADDSLEVESTGVWDKASTLKAVREIDFSKAELSDFKAVPLDNETNLVVYRVKLPGTDPAEYHGTIWNRRDGKWLAVFHQGTPIMAPAAGSPSPSK